MGLLTQLAGASFDRAGGYLLVPLRHFEWKFGAAFDAFRAQRLELLEVLEPLPIDAWERTATVSAPPGVVYEYSVLYYGDWMARHERSHLRHIGRILKEVG